MMRASTLNILLKYHQSPQSLGEALKQSLTTDPINPVLLDPQFTAIDRRVSLILQVWMISGSDSNRFNHILSLNRWYGNA